MKRLELRFAVWIVVAADIIAMTWLGWLYSRHAIVISVEKGADVATLTLTAATLVVAGLGVAIGVATIWGFKEIRESAIKAAREDALKAVADEMRRAFDQGQASPDAEQANQIAQDMDRPGNG